IPSHSRAGWVSSSRRSTCCRPASSTAATCCMPWRDGARASCQQCCSPRCSGSASTVGPAGSSGRRSSSSWCRSATRRARTPTGETEENCFRTIHAEINAIAQAAKNGASIRDADIYITHTPCIHCLKVLVNTGIRRIYYEHEYKRPTLEELLRHTDVTLECIK